MTFNDRWVEARSRIRIDYDRGKIFVDDDYKWRYIAHIQGPGKTKQQVLVKKGAEYIMKTVLKHFGSKKKWYAFKDVETMYNYLEKTYAED